MSRAVIVGAGYFRKGRLYLSRRDKFDALIGEQPDGGCIVRVEQMQEPRSAVMNSYYRVAVRVVSDETGEEEDDVHERLKAECLSWTQPALRGNGRLIDGRVLGATTTTLSNAEMWDFIERVHRSCARQGIYVPDPDTDALLGWTLERTA